MILRRKAKVFIASMGLYFRLYFFASLRGYWFIGANQSGEAIGLKVRMINFWIDFF